MFCLMTMEVLFCYSVVNLESVMAAFNDRVHHASFLVLKASAAAIPAVQGQLLYCRGAGVRCMDPEQTLWEYACPPYFQTVFSSFKFFTFSFFVFVNI